MIVVFYFQQEMGCPKVEVAQTFVTLGEHLKSNRSQEIRFRWFIDRGL